VDGWCLDSHGKASFGLPSASRLDSGRRRSIAARSANDSVTFSVSKRLCEPVDRNCPLLWRLGSILSIDIGKQIRSVLHLIEYHGRWIHFQERAWVHLGRRPNIRRLQGNITVTRSEEVLQKRRLAGLACSGQHYGRELGSCITENLIISTHKFIGLLRPKPLDQWGDLRTTHLCPNHLV